MRIQINNGKALINVLLVILILLLYITIPASFHAANVMGGFLYRQPLMAGEYLDHAVALECVVSWNAEAVAEILDVLMANNVRITFLVSGSWAQDCPQLLKRMRNEGHEIGIIGQNMFWTGEQQEIERDITDAVAVIEEKTGTRPNLYFAGTDPENEAVKAAGNLGLKVISCSVDLLSARGSKEEIISRALHSPFGGCIYLIEPTSAAAEALPDIIAGWHKQGFEIVGAGDIIRN